MKKSNIKRTFLVIGSTLMLITILFFSLNATQIASDISNAGFGFFASVRYSVFEYPIKRTSTFLDDLRTYFFQREQDRFTQQELDTLARYKAELEEAYRQILELKRLNDLSLSSMDYTTQAATVIYRPADTFLNQVVINVGSNDGIIEDSAVITPKGLIGRVQTVHANHSIVRLLTTQSDNNRVSVRIQISPAITAEAILQRYDANRGAFEVTLLDTNATINVGNTVITSGLGGVFPAGLLVGTVSEVQQLPNSLAVTVFVTPAADFHRFDYVLIVSRENVEYTP
jgi:rod shape-determining protein MreC